MTSQPFRPPGIPANRRLCLVTSLILGLGFLFGRGPVLGQDRIDPSRARADPRGTILWYDCFFS